MISVPTSTLSPLLPQVSILRSFRSPYLTYIAEDQILLELGSSDMYKGERKVKFTQGLRTLLTDLRSKKIRQFDVLAREIVAYRARFNGDTSKVLPLEGVEI